MVKYLQLFSFDRSCGSSTCATVACALIAQYSHALSRWKRSINCRMNGMTEALDGRRSSQRKDSHAIFSLHSRSMTMTFFYSVLHLELETHMPLLVRFLSLASIKMTKSGNVTQLFSSKLRNKRKSWFLCNFRIVKIIGNVQIQILTLNENENGSIETYIFISELFSRSKSNFYFGFRWYLCSLM